MKRLIGIAILCIGLGIMPSLNAQISQTSFEAPSRLLRHAPPYPYDVNGEYGFLRAMLRPTDASGKPRKQVDVMRKYAPWSSILVGHNFSSERWELGIDGLIFMLPHYNKYDGLWLGYEMQLSYLPSWGHKISLRSSQNYALKSRQWYSENHLLWHYAPEMNALSVLSAGYTSRAIIHQTPEDLYRGYYPQQISEAYGSEYKSYFAAMRHRINPLPRLGLQVVGSWTDRRPQRELEQQLVRHKALSLDAMATVVLLSMPSYDYVEPKHRRATPIAAQGYNPLELTLRYKEAFAPEADYSKYRLAEFNLAGAVAFNEDYKIDYRVTAGKFLNRERVYTPDERSVPQGAAVGRLPLSYQWTTLPVGWTAGEHWIMAETNLQAYGMLLPRYRQVSLGLDEALHLKAYKGAGSSAYAEAGYSIGWGNLFRLGVFVGYDFKRDTRFAFRLSVPVSMLLSAMSERH